MMARADFRISNFNHQREFDRRLAKTSPNEDDLIVAMYHLECISFQRGLKRILKPHEKEAVFSKARSSILEKLKTE